LIAIIFTWAFATSMFQIEIAIAVQPQQEDDDFEFEAIGQYLSALYNYQQQQYQQHNQQGVQQRRKLTGTCGNLGYHPDTTSTTGCINDNNYPPPWTSHPELQSKMFHSTYQECCNAFFDSGSSDCPYIDVCNSAGGGGGSGNPGYGYGPPPGYGPPQGYGPPTPFQGGPTIPPTPMPLLYYVDEATGVCVSNYEKQKPHWITSTYVEYEMCCNAPNVRDRTICLASKKPTTNDDGTMIDSNTPKTPLYYVVDLTGICVDHHLTPMTYRKQTFVDYNTCCNTSWDTTKCMMNEPTLPPSYAPTLSPTTSRPTPLATCPPPYNVNEQYSPGSQVEVNYVIYQCLPYPESIFCNQDKFQPPHDDPGPSDSTTTTSNTELWQDAWKRITLCQRPPSTSPSVSPTTSRPTLSTCKTAAKWHPQGLNNRRICTNSLEHPVAWTYEPLSTTYFRVTADECCNMWYGGGERCRIRDVCYE